MAVLGALAAVMAMVREQDAFFVAGPAIDFAWSLLRAGGLDRSRRLRAAAVGAAAFALTFMPQALAYLALNGRIGPSHLVARKMYWNSPHAIQVVGSPSHGFLMWTPLAAIACVGLLVLLRRLPADARIVGLAFVVMAALQVYIAGSVDSWTVAGAFGQRRFVALTSVLVVGAGRRRGRRARSPVAACRARRRPRCGDVVERGAHRAVRRGHDGSPAARARAYRLQYVRRRAARAARAGVAVPDRPHQLLRVRALARRERSRSRQRRAPPLPG